MVDRVEKTGANPYRVDETKEALDDEGSNNQDQGDENEGDADNFDKLNKKTNWKSLFDKSDLWQRNVEVKIEEIDRIKFLGINLNTNPALLKIRVFMYDGAEIHTAFMAISRVQAMQLKNFNSSAHIDVNLLTTEASLWLTIPHDEAAVDKEITKITKGLPKEWTFSQTFRMLVSRKTWIERLGIQDPVSKRINNEIVWVYLTSLTVASTIFFAVVYMMI